MNKQSPEAVQWIYTDGDDNPELLYTNFGEHAQHRRTHLDHVYFNLRYLC